MINKERLEELIKQGATIWDDVHCQIKLLNDITHITKLYENSLYVAEYFTNVAKTSSWWEDYTIDFGSLYEKEEDSKWSEEFGCIERTERLELPNWEEKNCIIYTFYSPIKNGGKQYEFRLFKGGNITIWRTNDMYKIFNESATKENYTIACRKVKELFLGTN